ncbi:MAG: hypothetical protein ACR2PL_01060 [Dehalococcoidia bacterium]
MPVTRQVLHLMTNGEGEHVNGLVRKGNLEHCDGSPVPGALEVGLSSADGKFAYRITDGIVELLEHRGIWLVSRSTSENENLRLAAEKEDVQGFHDDLGWQQAMTDSITTLRSTRTCAKCPRTRSMPRIRRGEAVPSRTGTVPP